MNMQQDDGGGGVFNRDVIKSCKVSTTTGKELWLLLADRVLVTWFRIWPHAGSEYNLSMLWEIYAQASTRKNRSSTQHGSRKSSCTFSLSTGKQIVATADGDWLHTVAAVAEELPLLESESTNGECELKWQREHHWWRSIRFGVMTSRSRALVTIAITLALIPKREITSKRWLVVVQMILSSHRSRIINMVQ